MATKKPSPAAWRERLARAGTYREAFSFDPARIKHPSAGWVAMFKDEFGMTDADFRVAGVTGRRRLWSLDVPARPRSRSIATAIAQIVGEENVEDSDYARVRYGHGKTVDENLALRAGRVEVRSGPRRASAGQGRCRGDRGLLR
ncbi:MAG: hypothetical protein V9E98_10520 [Candidatus Nanopelagicales bacterium]